MWSRSALVLLGVLLLHAPSVRADTVVLLSGERYTGILANREEARLNLLAQPRIALLLDASDELRRFPTDEVDYVVFEDGDQQQVIDVSTVLPATPAPRPVPPVFGAGADYGDGTVLVISGVLVGGLGALVKFGGEKATITDDSIDYEEHSYNGLNYTLMAIGGALVVGGIAANASGSAAGSEHATLMTVEPSLGPFSGGPALACCLRF